MKIGLGLGSGISPPTTVQMAVQAEASGFDSFWVTEGAIGDAFALLGAVAVSTSSINIGTSVVSVYVRSLPLLGMSAATVATLAPGRFRLGIGPSHREQVEKEHGLTYDQPLSRMRDAVSATRAASNNGTILGHELGTVSLDHFKLQFADTVPPFPILFGATGPRMVTMAGDLADGVIGVWRTPDDVAQLRRHLPAGAWFSLLLHCGIGSVSLSASEALATARERHGRFHRYRELFRSQSSLAGVTCENPDQLGEALDQYEAAGLDEVILLPVGNVEPGEAELAERLTFALQSAHALHKR